MNRELITPTKIYTDVTEGDWVHCNDCGEVMLLPHGADKCPECGAVGCLEWHSKHESFHETEYSKLKCHRITNRTLLPEDYLSEDTLKEFGIEPLSAEKILKHQSFKTLWDAFFEHFNTTPYVSELFEMIDTPVLYAWFVTQFIKEFTVAELKQIFSYQ